MNRIGSFMKTAYTQSNPFFATNIGRRQSAGMQSNGVGQSATMYSGGNNLRQKVRALSGNGTDNGNTQSTGSFAQSVLSSSQSYGDSLRMQRTNAKQTRTALKQLRYRFKDISSKILRSKTSAAARQVAGQARREVLRLKRERLNGSYDDEEIEAAIVHAKAMERVAKKKVKHLEEEEMAKASGGPCAGSLIDDEEETDETTSDEELQDAQRYDDQQALADEEGYYDDSDLYAVSQDYINAQEGNYKWIIVPHEIGESHIKDILGKCRKSVARYTDETADVTKCQVLVVDTIGVLSSIYRYGSISYIGGSFGKGIHNTLEAAIYGIPVLFGPKYHKFKEAVDLIACGGAFSISDKEQFTSLMDSLINSPAIAEAAGQSALKFVNQQLGATDVIIRQLVD